MKNLKKYLKILLIASGIGGLLYVAYLGNTQQNNGFSSYTNGSVTIMQKQQDLGDVSMQDGDKEIIFIFRNDSQESIELGDATTSCMCTMAYLIDENGTKSKSIQMRPSINLDKTIQPGDEYQLVVLFDPNAHGPNATGPVNRSVYITTNSNITPNLQFSFNGTVVK